MTLRMIPSTMARRPRAPVLCVSASFAIRCSASSSNVRRTPSSSSSFWNCLTRAFFGSVRMRTSASSSREFSVTTTGRRPMNSGISPFFIKSSGMILLSEAPTVTRRFERTSAPKPICFFPRRDSMISSRPSNEPPQIKRMFVVSICRSSCCGCLRPPCGGTDAVVPSRILSNPC